MSLFSLKRLFTLLLTVLILFALSACQSTDAAKETSPDTSLEASTVDSTEITPESSSETSTDATKAVEPFIVDDFELVALDGSKTNLYQYDGQIIVLNFWATWCGFCVEEMPLLDEMDKRDDIKVIAISVGEEAETVSKYIEEGGYDFDVYLDKEGILASKFGVTGFPTSLFLGKDFEYFYSYPGMLEQETFDSVLEAIDEIVKERSGQ
jgi:thiol-disulfide isomerase/thioredoxin